MPCLPDYDSPAALKAFLEENGMAMQKKFGQNFLVNRACREKLVSACSLDKTKTVWEVGPGLGAMTDLLIHTGARLTVFEIDHGFVRALESFFNTYDNFTMIHGDVLKTWPSIREKQGIPDCLFGNLPYNIAATMLADMITANVLFDTCVFTVQKEVANRMAAKPGTKDYSSFSVLCQYGYTVKTIMDIAPGSFWPKPNVVSRAVLLKKKKVLPECNSHERFFSVLRALFMSRRKTVSNNLKSWLAMNRATGYNGEQENLAGSILEQSGIDPSVRAETLKLDDFLKIAEVINRYEHTR